MTDLGIILATLLWIGYFEYRDHRRATAWRQDQEQIERNKKLDLEIAIARAKKVSRDLADELTAEEKQ